MDHESCLKENLKKKKRKKDHFYETALNLRQGNSNVFPDGKKTSLRKFVKFG